MLSVHIAPYAPHYDAFSQEFFLDQAPYNCTFCSGPAYNAIGPSVIQFGAVVPQIQFQQPVSERTDAAPKITGNP